MASEDALDRPRVRGGFGKAQKRKYAQDKAMQELLQPPKKPLAAWLSNPELLPKRPPGK